MPLSLIQVRALILGLLSVFLLVLVADKSEVEKLLASVWQGEKSDGLLTVAFLDVGQGDSVFIETPDGVQVLIDGGPDRSVLPELASVMPLFDRTLDVMVATHSDKDHLGGLTNVLENYTVKNIMRTENKNDTNLSTPTFTMKGASHCSDLSHSSVSDVVLGRQKFVEFAKNWLAQ